MKTKIHLSFIVLFFTLATIAQNGINYKAIVKESNGNVLNNTSITIRFIIYEGVALTNNVYEESHTATTNNNGLVIVNIGEGSTSDDFNTINWANDEHFLNVQIDKGEGLVDLGTTAFKAVPYAKVAENVNGLEVLIEGGNQGWRLVGRDSSTVGNIGENAIDFSQSITPSSELGATGDLAVAFGQNSRASGYSSFAMGDTASAIGGHTFVFGEQSGAVGNNSIAMGFNVSILGENSVAFGRNNIAFADNSLIGGNGNQIGNGGLGSIALGESNFIGGSNAVTIGYSNTATGVGAIAIGYDVDATGNYAIALGQGTTASGLFATTFGISTEASGDQSIALGNGTSASGSIASAMGFFSEASGDVSTALGWGTRAESYAVTALGRFNVGGGNPTNFIGSDPLFEIGNGNNTSNRSNALTVLKNGNTGIGTSTPLERLHIVNGRLRIGTETIEDTGSNQLSFNASLLPDADNVMRLGNNSFRWVGVWAVDGTINTSDRREKKNIKNLKYGLNEVLQIQPVSFKWKNANNPDMKLGLIAQDLQKLIPEVVKTHIWEKDETTGTIEKKELNRLGVYYSDLIPVLIKAIQEQQEIIESQEKALKKSDANYKVLLSRIETIESNLSN